MAIRQKIAMKTPADNGRFGASGAVTRPKVCANLEVLRPVRAVVEAPPAPSRWDVVGNFSGQHSGNRRSRKPKSGGKHKQIKK